MAMQNDPLGYSSSVCYKCIIASQVEFTKALVIVQDPLDCSSSLSLNTAFSIPAAIPYVSVGSNVLFASDYKSIWDHT